MFFYRIFGPKSPILRQYLRQILKTILPQIRPPRANSGTYQNKTAQNRALQQPRMRTRGPDGLAQNFSRTARSGSLYHSRTHKHASDRRGPKQLCSKSYPVSRRPPKQPQLCIHTRARIRPAKPQTTLQQIVSGISNGPGGLVCARTREHESDRRDPGRRCSKS